GSPTPKLPTTTSRWPLPSMSASPIQAGSLLDVEYGLPSMVKLPLPSFLNTAKLPSFCWFSLDTTRSGQPSPFTSPQLTKLGFLPPQLSVSEVNPPPCLPYRTVMVLPGTPGLVPVP